MRERMFRDQCGIFFCWKQAWLWFGSGCHGIGSSLSSRETLVISSTTFFKHSFCVKPFSFDLVCIALDGRRGFCKREQKALCFVGPLPFLAISWFRLWELGLLMEVCGRYRMRMSCGLHVHDNSQEFLCLRSTLTAITKTISIDETDLWNQISLAYSHLSTHL